MSPPVYECACGTKIVCGGIKVPMPQDRESFERIIAIHAQNCRGAAGEATTDE